MKAYVFINDERIEVVNYSGQYGVYFRCSEVIEKLFNGKVHTFDKVFRGATVVVHDNESYLPISDIASLLQNQFLED